MSPIGRIIAAAEGGQPTSKEIPMMMRGSIVAIAALLLCGAGLQAQACSLENNSASVIAPTVVAAQTAMPTDVSSAKKKKKPTSSGSTAPKQEPPASSSPSGY
jgi:hypothetical protein